MLFLDAHDCREARAECIAVLLRVTTSKSSAYMRTLVPSGFETSEFSRR